MSESVSDIEREIEASRARLDDTIGRIQDRLTPGNLVGEMLRTERHTTVNGLYDGALDVVRRNPVPVLLIAAGVGLLLTQMAKGSRPRSLEPLAHRLARKTGRIDPESASRPALNRVQAVDAAPSEPNGVLR